MMNKFLLILLAIALTTSCGNSNYDINVTTYYHPNKSFHDFVNDAVVGYLIDEASIEKLQMILNQKGYTSPEEIEKDIVADISGWYVSKLDGREFKTYFYNFIFEYSGTSPNGSLDTLTFYFDNKEGLISISCPQSDKIECDHLEYPTNRGATISFGKTN